MRSASGMLFLLLPLLCCSCEEEDTTMAAYRQDVLDVETDADGFALRLLRDDGTVLPVINQRGGLLKDTVYRVAAAYVAEESGARLSSVSRVATSRPAAGNATEEMNDPADIEAVWRGGPYINLRLSLKTGGGTHRVGFRDCGFSTAADGSKRLNVEFLHSQNGDPLYYTVTTYAACALDGLEQALLHGRDSVSLTANTFSGTKTWTLPF